MKVETFKIKGWKTPVTGVVMMENKDWILINDVLLEYQADGYSLLAKKYVKDRYSTKLENQIALVLELKGHKAKISKKFELGELGDMLEWIQDRYGLIQLQDKLEQSLEIGFVEEIDKKKLGLVFMKPNGKFKEKYLYEYKIKGIRKITFDTDYLYSLSLLADHKAN